MLLLRDVFDYGYDEIAAIVGKSEANARQLAARARRHVEEGRPRFEASREQRDELAERFFAAAQEGDLGGARGAARPRRRAARRRRRQGARARARRCTAAAAWRARWSPGCSQGARIAGASMRQVEVNGQPGALLLDGEERVISVMALDIADGQIQGVRSIVNPDKLGHVGPVADLRELLDRSGRQE